MEIPVLLLNLPFSFFSGYASALWWSLYMKQMRLQTFLVITLLLQIILGLMFLYIFRSDYLKADWLFQGAAWLFSSLLWLFFFLASQVKRLWVLLIGLFFFALAGYSILWLNLKSFAGLQNFIFLKAFSFLAHIGIFLIGLGLSLFLYLRKGDGRDDQTESRGEFLIFFTITGIFYYFTLRQILPVIQGLIIPQVLLLGLVGLALAVISYFIIEPKNFSIMTDKKNSNKKWLQLGFLPILLATGLFLITLSWVNLWGNSAENDSTRWKNVKELSENIKARNYSVKWHSNLEAALKLAKSQQTWVLVDFWAEWCVACHKMEKELFQSESFIEAAAKANLVLARIDLTNENDYTTALSYKYDIVGLPTVILVDGSGELTGTLLGYIEKNKTMSQLKDLLKKK